MTLLELLVALSIFAVLGAALMPVLSGAMSSRNEAVNRVALGVEARMILDRLEQDLAAHFDTGFDGALPVRFTAPEPDTSAFAGERVLLETTTLVARGVTLAEAFVGGEDLPVLAVDRGDQAQVVWRIDDAGRLLRQQLRPPRTEPVVWEDVPVEVLSERAELILEFYGDQTWVTAWDSGRLGANRGRVPEAVRSTLRVADDDHSLELVSTVLLPVLQRADRPGRARRARP